MALLGLLSLAALSFCVLVLVVEPRPAYGSSRGSYGLASTSPAPPLIGVCASTVAMHGYKCQEFEVRVQTQ